MDKLPAEILCDIFLKTLPGERERDESPGALTQAQLYVSHVCRRWRDLALSFGELWSYLHLDGRLVHVYEAEKWWKCSSVILHIWLLRSKRAPLNYTVYGRFPYSPPDQFMHGRRDAERIILTLVSEQYRWEHIRIGLFNLTVSPKFPGFVLINMPNLISLELTISFTSTMPSRVIINLARSSRLKKLTVGGDSELDSGGVAINTLTQAHLYHRYCTNPQMPQACVDFLRSAPLLIEFRGFISGVVPRDVSNSLKGDRVLLTKLRVLELLSHPLFVIIDRLTLPSLENLTFGRVAGANAASILRSFLERSRPPLTKLRVSDGNTDAFIPSLKLLPALEFLYLRNMTPSERFFRELVIPVNAGGGFSDHRQRILCPSLAYIGFSALRAPDSGEAFSTAIFSMVTSRAEIWGTFKTVEGKLGPMTEVTRLVVNDENWSIGNLRTLLGDCRTFTVRSSMQASRTN